MTVSRIPTVYLRTKMGDTQVWVLIYIRFVPDGNFGDMFSLGQLILEAVLLPVAVRGLWMAGRYGCCLCHSQTALLLNGA